MARAGSGAYVRVGPTAIVAAGPVPVRVAWRVAAVAGQVRVDPSRLSSQCGVQTPRRSGFVLRRDFSSIL